MNFLGWKATTIIKADVPIFDHVILIQLHGQPIAINVIQAYATTAERPDEDLELLDQHIDEARKVTKKGEFNLS